MLKLSKPACRLGYLPHKTPEPTRSSHKAGSTAPSTASKPTSRSRWGLLSGRKYSPASTAPKRDSSSQANQPGFLSASWLLARALWGRPAEAKLLMELTTEGRFSSASAANAHTSRVRLPWFKPASSGAAEKVLLAAASKTAPPKKERNTIKEKTNWRILIQSVFAVLVCC